MKSIFTFVLFVGVLVAFSAPCAAQCATATNVYAFTYSGKNYEIIKERKSWADAAACATARGGNLAHIETNAEATALYNAIAAAGVSTTYTAVDDGGGIAYVWIGATDKFTEGTWIWGGKNVNTNLNFWTGQGAAGGNNGLVINGQFNKWGGYSKGMSIEPDDFDHNQDAAAIALATWPFCAPSCTQPLGIAGEWNDISAANTLYYIVELGAIVPVELMNFDAKWAKNGVDLQWSTASEQNNKGFEIESSLDGITWSTIAWISGQGNASKLTHYSFLDKPELSEILYYRLKQFDFNGQSTYSKTVSIASEKSKTNIKIYPSVIQQDLTIKSTLNPIDGIEIINSVGQIVVSKKLNTFETSIDLHALPSGYYLVKAQSNEQVLIQKIFKQ